MAKSFVTVRYWMEFTFSVDIKEGDNVPEKAPEKAMDEVSKLTIFAMPRDWYGLPDFQFCADDFEVIDWEDD